MGREEVVILMEREVMEEGPSRVGRERGKKEMTIEA